jgi:hypothetical protein
VASEGEVVTLDDGRQFRLLWPGSVNHLTKSFVLRLRNSPAAARYSAMVPADHGPILLPVAKSYSIACVNCPTRLTLGEPYYTRSRGGRSNPKHYCLGCALLLGFVEPVKPVPVVQVAEVRVAAARRRVGS